MRKSEKKRESIRFREGLQPLRRDAGGMDIGASEIWVDVGVENDPEPVRRFETFTADLNRMVHWLVACGVRTVVMESTGVRRVRSLKTVASRCYWLTRGMRRMSAAAKPTRW